VLFGETVFLKGWKIKYNSTKNSTKKPTGINLKRKENFTLSQGFFLNNWQVLVYHISLKERNHTQSCQLNFALYHSMVKRA